MRAFTLPLVECLATAHGPIRVRQGQLIRLFSDDGYRGQGEATPLAEFGTEDGPASRRALARGIEDLIAAGSFSLEDGLALIWKSASHSPCARAALDSALHDLAAQEMEQPLSTWLHMHSGLAGRPASRVAVQAIVSGGEPESVWSSAERLVAEGFDAFKLKLATNPDGRGLEADLARVAALRDCIGSERRIRLDANEAWTFPEAMAALDSLACYSIDFVEQPVPRHELMNLRELDRCAAIPVAADEALLGSGWSACLESRSASIFVVKPSALGGIRPALALASRARSLGIRVIWSSLIDGAVSRAVGVVLAAGLGSEGEVHGLGTAGLLARDLVDPVTPNVDPQHGSILLRKSNGLDCALGDLVDEDSEIWGELRLFERRS
ncbi:MAG TPA: o-succinylbenzoate synthase [Myxococcales bacterium]|nr:o-succinylbenzoate synthase [Myxococcales bacterium]HIK84897.1 o-succinylbenzoate synthase [Myxococcales bacterium]